VEYLWVTIGRLKTMKHLLTNALVSERMILDSIMFIGWDKGSPRKREIFYAKYSDHERIPTAAFEQFKGRKDFSVFQENLVDSL
jgi:hypothetical protein